MYKQTFISYFSSSLQATTSLSKSLPNLSIKLTVDWWFMHNINFWSLTKTCRNRACIHCKNKIVEITSLCVSHLKCLFLVVLPAKWFGNLQKHNLIYSSVHFILGTHSHSDITYVATTTCTTNYIEIHAIPCDCTNK